MKRLTWLSPAVLLLVAALGLATRAARPGPVPRPTPAATPAEFAGHAVPTPVEPSLAILGATSFVDEWGDYHLVGEVRNEGFQHATLVKVIATLYDEGATIIGVETGWAEVDPLAPGAVSPFHVRSDVSGADHYRLQTSRFVGEPGCDDLELAGVSDRVDEIGWLRIFGEVHNRGETPATRCEVVATIYDAQGQIVDSAFAYAERNMIPAGESSPFEVSLPRREGFARYVLHVQGE